MERRHLPGGKKKQQSNQTEPDKTDVPDKHSHPAQSDHYQFLSPIKNRMKDSVQAGESLSRNAQDKASTSIKLQKWLRVPKTERNGTRP